MYRQRKLWGKLQFVQLLHQRSPTWRTTAPWPAPRMVLRELCLVLAQHSPVIQSMLVQVSSTDILLMTSELSVIHIFFIIGLNVLFSSYENLHWRTNTSLYQVIEIRRLHLELFLTKGVHPANPSWLGYFEESRSSLEILAGWGTPFLIIALFYDI